MAVFESVWLAPFAEGAYGTIIKWYLATVGAQLLLAIVFERTGVFDNEVTLSNFSLKERLFSLGAVAPVLEECVFRVLPVAIIGLGPGGILFFTVAWVLLHGKRALVIVLSLPVYAKLALGGMLAEALVLHMVHNTLVVLVDYYWPE